MSVTVSCGSCGKRLLVPDALYEKRVRGRVMQLACRDCGAMIRVDGTVPPPPVEEIVAREPSPPSTRAPLARIGRYALFEQFAAGGMATVHFGRLDGAGGFSRVVAIKRLLPELVQNEDFKEMLLKEARLAARVRHPNVVPTLDVVASKGDVLLVLEYVHGESLNTLCRQQVKEKKEYIPIDIAASVMHGVLQGLEAVHEATDETGRSLGLVHRDISPPNVIVGADGLARVLDFGIAKALEQLDDSVPNRIKGKSGYMSPEQIRGERLTQRSDVFSCGIMLWEMLATRRLFTAPIETERMQTILDGNYPRPRSLRQELSAELDEVVMRALSLEPEHRFADTRAFATALERAAPSASTRKVADWVTELAHEKLQERGRIVAMVETFAHGNVDHPLSSSPFTAELALMTPMPPPPRDLLALSQAEEGRPSSRAEELRGLWQRFIAFLRRLFDARTGVRAKLPGRK
jgi:serine/threonine-protein kinase